MNNVESITSKIIEDAKRQQRQILATADEEARRIIEKAQDEAEEKKQAKLEAAQQRCKADEERIIAQANMEARKNILAVKQQVIDEVYAKAIDNLSNLPCEQYVQLIIKLVLNYSESCDEEIIMSAKDKAKLPTDFITQLNAALSEKNAAACIKFSSEERDLENGFVLKKGDTEINCSFEALIRQYKDELSPSLAKILF